MAALCRKGLLAGNSQVSLRKVLGVSPRIHTTTTVPTFLARKVRKKGSAWLLGVQKLYEYIMSVVFRKIGLCRPYCWHTHSLKVLSCGCQASLHAEEPST